MKHIFKFTTLVASMFLGIIYLTNCRHDVQPIEQKDLVSLDSRIEEIQTLFEKKGYTSSLKEKFNDSLEITWKPNWQAFTHEQRGDSLSFTYIPLIPQLLNVKTNVINDKATFGFTKHLAFKSARDNSKNFYVAKYTSSVPDSIVDLSNFTGTLHWTNLENMETSYYKYQNGRIDNSSKKGLGSNTGSQRTSGCIVTVECSWGVWDCGNNVYITSTTGDITCNYPVWIPCPTGHWENNGTTVQYYCTNDPSIPSVPIVLNPTFTGGVVYTPPAVAVSNMAEYLKCFKTIRSGAAYKVSLYVDKPVENSIYPFNPAAQGKHTVGHAFLEFEMTMPRSNLYPSGEVVRRSVGFYPKNTSNPLHPASVGIMGNDEGYNGTLDVVASFKATDAEFTAMQTLAESYAAGGYNLNTRNCSNFTSDVLAQMGVNVPNDWQQAFWYVANGGVNVGGPSVGSYGEIIKGLQSPKLISKSTQSVAPKSNVKSCN